MLETLTIHTLFATALAYLLWRFVWQSNKKDGACGGCKGCGTSPNAPEGRTAHVELRISAPPASHS